MRRAIGLEAISCARVLAAAPTWPLFDLVMDPVTGMIEMTCQACGEELVPMTGNRRGDGRLVCAVCPSASYEVEPTC